MSDVQELKKAADQLAGKHFDLGGTHADEGILHCTCGLAAQARAARNAWEAQLRKENYADSK